LINELKDFPNASHDDFSDAASRVYDLTIQSVSNKEMNEAAALNEMDIWS
jgi:phage terminase large subunit-like protein